jgi:hypothetical protein
MAKLNLYTITIERKVRETHTVAARTRTEAALAFGRDDFQSIDEVSRVVVDERVLTPHLTETDYDPNQA